MITVNLAQALNRLRLDNQFRTLWIDAVCIDQPTLVEKSSQIALMTRIYHRASNVLIWLGPGNQQTKTAFRFLESMSEITTTWDNPHRWNGALYFDSFLLEASEQREAREKEARSLINAAKDAHLRTYMGDLGLRECGLCKKLQ
jgi:hypothetical protein